MTIWIVKREEAGKKLVTYIGEKLGKTCPAREIKRQLESNCCEVNGAIERFASREVKEGDRVQFRLLEPKSVETDLSMPWRTLYADDEVLVCLKPPGIVVDDPSTLKQLKEHFGPLILVHRLDRDTSGALVFARTAEAAAHLELQFRKQEVEKVYFALVDGVPLESQGEIVSRLGKVNPAEGQPMWGKVPAGKEGKYAQTFWRLLGRGRLASLIRCQPTTGRTHQLRAHLKGLGHPILGDYQYARRFACSYRPKRCLLHAAEVTFTHPRKGVRQHVRAPLPRDFEEALQALGIPLPKSKNAKKSKSL